MGERWGPGPVVAVGLVLGGLTSWLQTWLPHEVAPLANSAGPWCAVVVLPMVLVLEGIRSYVQVGDTTYRPYWVGEVVAGALLAGLLALRAAGRTGIGG